MENINITKKENNNNSKCPDLITYAPQMKYKVPPLIISPFQLNSKTEEPFSLCSINVLKLEDTEYEIDNCSILSEKESLNTYETDSIDEDLFCSISTENSVKKLRKSLKQIKSNICKKVSKDDEEINQESFNYSLSTSINNLKHEPNWSILSILKAFNSFNICD